MSQTCILRDESDIKTCILRGESDVSQPFSFFRFEQKSGTKSFTVQNSALHSLSNKQTTFYQRQVQGAQAVAHLA